MTKTIDKRMKHGGKKLDSGNAMMVTIAQHAVERISELAFKNILGSFKRAKVAMLVGVVELSSCCDQRQPQRIRENHNQDQPTNRGCKSTWRGHPS